MFLLRFLFGLLFGGRSGSGPRDSYSLSRWQDAEERDVVKPRDPRTKLCFENLGRPVTIIYHGTARTIVPRRVYSKPQYKKTYVQAESDGALLTFDVDDMKLPPSPFKKTKAKAKG